MRCCSLPVYAGPSGRMVCPYEYPARWAGLRNDGPLGLNANNPTHDRTPGEDRYWGQGAGSPELIIERAWGRTLLTKVLGTLEGEFVALVAKAVEGYRSCVPGRCRYYPGEKSLTEAMTPTAVLSPKPQLAITDKKCYNFSNTRMEHL
jgi:hypothetical protein